MTTATEKQRIPLAQAEHIASVLLREIASWLDGLKRQPALPQFGGVS